MLDEQSKQRVKQLCELIAKEQDHYRFSRLLAELNTVLEGNVPLKMDGSSKNDTGNVSDGKISPTNFSPSSPSSSSSEGSS